MKAVGVLENLPTDNEAISRLRENESLGGVKEKYERPNPSLAYRTFKRAGAASLADLIKDLPRVLYDHWKYDR